MRPGPLRDLPLEQFLDANSPLTTPLKIHPRSNKRPLSPGTPLLCTPAKRRILNVEGIFITGSSKTPLASANGRIVHIHDLLRSPDSPAKRLDFGCAKSSEAENVHVLPESRTPSKSGSRDPTSSRRAPRTPLIRTSTSSLGSPSRALPFATSPSSLRAPVEMDTDDYFSPKKGLVTTRARDLPAPAPTTRPVAQLTDATAHYPGFDVYLDVFGSPTQTTKEEMVVVVEKIKVTRDANKENVPPRERRSKPPAFDVHCQTILAKTGRSPLRESDVIDDTDLPPATLQFKAIEEPLTPKPRSTLLPDSPSSALIQLTPGLTITPKPERERNASINDLERGGTLDEEGGVREDPSSVKF